MPLNCPLCLLIKVICSFLIPFWQGQKQAYETALFQSILIQKPFSGHPVILNFARFELVIISCLPMNTFNGEKINATNISCGKYNFKSKVLTENPPDIQVCSMLNHRLQMLKNRYVLNSNTKNGFKYLL